MHLSISPWSFLHLFLGQIGYKKIQNLKAFSQQLLCPIQKYLCVIRILTYFHFYDINSGFPRALENLENHKKKFHAWKNHGIWKKLKIHGKIMEFCEIICLLTACFPASGDLSFLSLFQNALVVPDILLSDTCSLKNVCNLGMSEVFFDSYIRSNQKLFIHFWMECKSHIESFDLSDS